jgi:hypothetical protein
LIVTSETLIVASEPLAGIIGIRQGLIVDLCSEKSNHPVNNPKLKADKRELPVAGEKRGYYLNVTTFSKLTRCSLILWAACS